MKATPPKELHEPTIQATKAMTTFNRHLLAASLTLGALAGTATAGTINWGGAFFTTNYSADGTVLESGATAAVASGEVMYELGVFQNLDGSEFTPTYANLAQWSDRWVPLDSSGNSSTSGYTDTASYFGGIAAVGASGDQIATVTSSLSGGVLVSGFQAYIWGYDTKDLGGTAQPEWFLVTGQDAGASGASTSNWVVPDSSASNNGTFDIQWDIASASVAIVGQIDNNKGDGEMVDPIDPFGASDHQFATVPEPGSLVLTLLASLTLLRRRR